ncbi:MAG: Spx/MgsR family RNA polymerase-binding regulatory protein [Aestuariivirga sp.]
MKLKVFGLTKCSTCQKALAWFDDNSIEYQFTDVKESALYPAQVARWSSSVGGWEKMVNRAGYTWRGLSPAETENLTEKKAIALAIRNPSLIRRPLIEHADGSVTVGFSEKVRAQLRP